MATYEKGDKNADEVKLFQEAIGMDDADGRFGPETVAAVKAWQRDNDQKADGMVGPDMLLALGLHDLLIVENGDEGDLVKRIQAFLEIDEDGEYGKETVKAVREWQKQNGLKATGSADAKTLGEMGLLDDAGDHDDDHDKNDDDDKPEPAARSKPAAPVSAPAPARPSSVSVPSVPRASTPSAGAAPKSGPITSWAYQLSDIDPRAIAALDVDLAVIDYAADGDDATAFKPADLAAMKQRPAGGSKRVVSYMSIGEAEDYRYYWQKSFESKKTRPAWLDDLNPDWEGNYKVRYWDPAWQSVILGSPGAYLDRIIAAGFDGVYLDIIDAFEYWRDEKPERTDAAELMVAFVSRIAAYARAKRPDFLIIPQNGEELLRFPEYRKVISIQAKEDIFYGQDGDGKANKSGAVQDCLENIKYATDAGIPVIAIEYLKDAKKQADAEQKLEQAGCCAYFGPRKLDKLAV